MSKIIEGIPESFTREQYVAVFDALGLSPYVIASLEFRANGVYAVVFESDEDGHRIIVDSPDKAEWASHRVFIPVDGGLPDRDGFQLVSALRSEQVSA